MRNTDTIVKAGKKKVRKYIADSDTPFSVPKGLSKPKIGYYTYFYQNNRRFLTFLQFDSEQGLFYMTARYTPDKYHLIKEWLFTNSWLIFLNFRSFYPGLLMALA